jgi:hypothetical protein
MEIVITEIGLAFLGVLFTALWWFYRKRDEERQKAVDLLFRKHDEDVQALNDLKLLIASKHYERSDLDAKFDKMEETTRDGFKNMGEKFDKLSNTLLDFLAQLNGFAKNGHKQ